MSPVRLGLVLLLSGSLASLAGSDDRPAAAGHEGPPGSPPPAMVKRSAAPVSFLIETIRVEGVRGASARIVASETLLTVGNAYTEAQLRQALHRVERLPFVLEADCSLRRGTERGRFELVITVSQTWPVFAGGTLDLVRTGSAYAFARDRWEARAATEVGGRIFLGAQNEITGTVGVTGSSLVGVEPHFNLDLTYRHHDVLGRHVLGSLFLRKPRPSGDLSGDWQAGGSLALPLSRASAVGVDVALGWSEWRGSCDGPACPPSWFQRQTSTVRQGGLSWRRDTTDDPFAPQDGSRLEAGLAYRSVESTLLSSVPLGGASEPAAAGPQRTSFDGHEVLSLVGARRYWPILPGAALGLGGGVSFWRWTGEGWLQSPESTWTGVRRGSRADSTVELELLGRPRPAGRAATQLWWVARMSAQGVWSRGELDPPPEPLSGISGWNDTRSGWARVTVGIAARGRWGIARLELSYEYEFRSRSELR